MQTKKASAASAAINRRTEGMTTLYKKVGRRYKPVAEHEEWDSFPEGAHLVVCSPGSTLRRFNIDPDRAGLLAAAEPLREKIRSLVVELHKMRRFQKAIGGEGYWVEYASVGEIADAVVDLIVKEAGK
jgi:DNA-dependent RNA polymerase auxiliary subunit epsilon